MWSKAICWIDDCRIPFVDEKDCDKACKSDSDRGQSKGLWLFTEKQHKRTGGNTKGRFPANILVCDDMLNDGVITKTTSSKGHIRKGNVVGDNRTPVAAGLFGDGNWIEGTNINDKGTNSRYYDIDKWFDKIIE